MDDFTYTLTTEENKVDVRVATEVAEPDRVYLSMQVDKMVVTAALSLEQAQELRFALKQAFTQNDHLNEYHIEDLDEIDAFLEGDRT